jgi:hypothetical protein
MKVGKLQRQLIRGSTSTGGERELENLKKVEESKTQKKGEPVGRCHWCSPHVTSNDVSNNRRRTKADQLWRLLVFGPDADTLRVQCRNFENPTDCILDR